MTEAETLNCLPSDVFESSPAEISRLLLGVMAEMLSLMYEFLFLSLLLCCESCVASTAMHPLRRPAWALAVTR